MQAAVCSNNLTDLFIYAYELQKSPNPGETSYFDVEVRCEHLPEGSEIIFFRVGYNVSGDIKIAFVH